MDDSLHVGGGAGAGPSGIIPPGVKPQINPALAATASHVSNVAKNKPPDPVASFSPPMSSHQSTNYFKMLADKIKSKLGNLQFGEDVTISQFQGGFQQAWGGRMKRWFWSDDTAKTVLQIDNIGARVINEAQERKNSLMKCAELIDKDSEFLKFIDDNHKWDSYGPAEFAACLTDYQNYKKMKSLAVERAQESPKKIEMNTLEGKLAELQQAKAAIVSVNKRLQPHQLAEESLRGQLDLGIHKPLSNDKRLAQENKIKAKIAKLEIRLRQVDVAPLEFENPPGRPLASKRVIESQIIALKEELAKLWKNEVPDTNVDELNRIIRLNKGIQKEIDEKREELDELLIEPNQDNLLHLSNSDRFVHLSDSEKVERAQQLYVEISKLQLQLTENNARMNQLPRRLSLEQIAKDVADELEDVGDKINQINRAINQIQTQLAQIDKEIQEIDDPAEQQAKAKEKEGEKAQLNAQLVNKSKELEPLLKIQKNLKSEENEIKGQLKFMDDLITHHAKIVAIKARMAPLDAAVTTKKELDRQKLSQLDVKIALLMTNHPDLDFENRAIRSTKQTLIRDPLHRLALREYETLKEAKDALNNQTSNEAKELAKLQAELEALTKNPPKKPADADEVDKQIKGVEDQLVAVGKEVEKAGAAEAAAQVRSIEQQRFLISEFQRTRSFSNFSLTNSAAAFVPSQAQLNEELAAIHETSKKRTEKLKAEAAKAKATPAPTGAAASGTVSPKDVSIDVPPDGNCLFCAIGVALRREHTTNDSIQKKLGWNADPKALTGNLRTQSVLLQAPAAQLRRQAAAVLKAELTKAASAPKDDELRSAIASSKKDHYTAKKDRIEQEKANLKHLRDGLAALRTNPNSSEIRAAEANIQRIENEQIPDPNAITDLTYVMETEADKVFGDSAHILALCKEYDIAIEVIHDYDKGNRKGDTYNSGPNRPKITLAYTGNNHYKYVPSSPAG